MTVIRHQNADAMVLAVARLGGIHPPDNIQNGGRPGVKCLLGAHWLGPYSGYSSRPSVCLCSVPGGWLLLFTVLPE